MHDETEPERGVLLRQMTGGHDADITALAYSHTLSLIASGASDGLVQIWDYEFGRLDGTCKGHSAAITCLVFLEPYPGLLVSDANGNMCVWAMRPAADKHRAVLWWKNTVQKKADPMADNATFLTAAPTSSRTTATTVTKMVVDVELADEADSDDDTRTAPGKRSGRAAAAPHAAWATPRDVSPDDASLEHKHGGGGRRREWGSFGGRGDESLDSSDGFRGGSFGSDDEADAPPTRKTVKRYRVATGDDQGFVAIWDLLPGLRSLEARSKLTGGKFAPMWAPVDCSNPRRILSCDARTGRTSAVAGGRRPRRASKLEFDTGPASSSTAPVDLVAEEELAGRTFNTAAYSLQLHSEALLDGTEVPLVQRWKAHSETIGSIGVIAEPPSLITASLDRMVKIWDKASGDCLGVLRQGCKERHKGWKFEVDVEAQYRRKLAEAATVLEELAVLEKAESRDRRKSVADSEDLSAKAAADVSHMALDMRLLLDDPDDNSNSVLLMLGKGGKALDRLGSRRNMPKPGERHTPRLKPIDARSAGRGLGAATSRTRSRRTVLAKQQATIAQLHMKG